MKPLVIPLVLLLTQADGAPVIARDRVARFVEELNGRYAAAGICFSLEAVREVARPADLKTYRDRHAFFPYTVAGAINVVLVRTIFDPQTSESTKRTAAKFGFVPDHWLDGAHIERHDGDPDNYAIVRADADKTTISHEVGHILGEGHSSDSTNIMSYGLDPVGFDARQIRSFRARIQKLLAGGALRAAARRGG
jgi:hypothetical protein